MDPHTVPEATKSSPAPLVHAATKAVRQQLTEAYRIFVAAYRAAAERLRLGYRDAVFPEGSFPSALPWIPEARPGPA